MKKAFSIVEVMIIVAILGILAAMVMPDFRDHTGYAREAAARENLRLLRHAIEYYAAQHNGTPPGYLNGNPSNDASDLVFWMQLTNASKSSGEIALGGSDGYPCGPYLSERAKNPFNDSSTVVIVPAMTSDFKTHLSDDTAWLYQPSTKTIKLARKGQDSRGDLYLDY